MKYMEKKQSKYTEEDILVRQCVDRRLLSNVPDKEYIRIGHDRRGDIKLGIRYEVDYTINLKYQQSNNKWVELECKARNISGSGIAVVIEGGDIKSILEAKNIKLSFEIKPGSMPEGYEMKVKTKAKVIRTENKENGEFIIGLKFSESLAEYSAHKKDQYLFWVSSCLLVAITLFIILMRVESIIYFKFNKWLYLYSILAAIFLLSRYFFGMLYRAAPIDVDFTPGVTIIIPCFNEEEWIQKTILSCINQNYDVDKLEIIIVDDCSNDHSVEEIDKIVQKLYKEAERYQTKGRIKYFVQEINQGKREALARGVIAAKHELVVFVDSDSFLDPFAIRNLVQPFKDPKMGGVSGRTDVANTYTNTLTKMQSVRYYIAFRIMKAAEAYFDAVTCLSGPLSCYRKQIILDNMDNWLNQSFLGQKATFGDDRSMTNLVLKHQRTSYQDTAVCSTIVPNKYKVFLKQQMRWKRSWLRESIIAAKFMWKKEPFMAVSFYMGLIVPIAAPIIVVYNLIVIPILHRVFPTTFLLGLLMMALLMSFAQLFLRKSTTWIFGLLFCMFYEGVLLWQMPIAWLTFWKTTWGTRMTPKDLEINQEKETKKKVKSNISG